MSHGNTSRRYLVAGNWKLNMGPRDGRQLATDLQDLLAGRDLKGDVLAGAAAGDAHQSDQEGGVGQPHGSYLNDLAESTGGVYYENLADFREPLQEIGHAPTLRATATRRSASRS